MRKIALATLFIFVFSTVALAASPFSDVKASHWAYDAISKLAAKGYVEGYKDGTFKGDKTLTRYELAMVISRLIEKMKGGGVSSEDLRTLEKLTVEFSDELALLGVKVTALEDEMKMLKGDVAALKQGGHGKVSLSGDILLSMNRFDRKFDTISNDDWFNYAKLGMNFFMNVDEDVTAFVRFMADKVQLNNLGVADTVIDEAYVDIKNFFRLGDVRVGRQWMSLGHSIVLDDKLDGLKFSKVMDQVAFTLFAFSTRNQSMTNDQFYGNTLGTKNFYMFSDDATISAGQNAAGTNYRYNSANNAAAPAITKITLYSTPYPSGYDMAGNCADAYVGSKTAANPNWTYAYHNGFAIDHAVVTNELLPYDVPVGNYATVGFGVTPDTAGTAQMTPNVVTRDWDIQSASGLDSWGFNVSVDFGGHALAGYFLQRSFDRYDPYTMLGDPWAAMVDMNNDLALDVDHLGRDLSPAADPTYWGITLDGNILKNLDYFFEYVSFDSDISNIGVDPLTGIAKATATTWKGNNLDKGNAWLLGIDWDLTDDLNLIVQYGVGDEEFVPASVYKSEYLNGMSGRWNADLAGLATFGDARLGESTGALTGVKDLLVKFSADFNDKTSGYIKYEVVKDNDSSAARLIAGDPMVTGHAAQDYKLLTLRFKHIYKPNTILGLRYDLMKYDSDVVDSLHVTNLENFLTDDVNGGGWQRISADVQVKF